MGNRILVAAGTVGAVFAVACCAAPSLVLALGVFSLAAAAWSGWFLLPALFVLAALAGYGLYRHRRAGACTKPLERDHT